MDHPQAGSAPHGADRELPPHVSAQDAKLRQLKQLLELKERGALSDQEFNREKQKILLQ